MNVAAQLESVLAKLSTRARQSSDLLHTCEALEERCAAVETRLQRLGDR
jgi:hypothetical protein